MTSIDLHDIRSKLKLIEDTGESSLFDNRGDVGCPVCGDVFDEVLETTESTRRLEPSERIDICIVNDKDRLHLFTHA